MSSSDDTDDIKIEVNKSHIDADADDYSSPSSASELSNSASISTASNEQQQQEEEEEEQGDSGWLDNPKRICFIMCACLVFAIMTFVILLQLYSDDYQSWTTFKGIQYIQPHTHTRKYVYASTQTMGHLLYHQQIRSDPLI